MATEASIPQNSEAKSLPLELLTEAQVREKRHQMQHAMQHIENQNEMKKDGIGSKLNREMLTMLTTRMDVAEVYSPARVAQMARQMGLRGGWSLDLTTEDADGRSWDFNQLEMRNRAVRKVPKDRPRLLIGSPMCTGYNVMNNINYARLSQEEIDEKMKYARLHLEFCIKLYRIQMRESRYFLHEHPQSASSWQEEAIMKLLQEESITRAVRDQCRYGLTTKDGINTGPAKKPIGFITNSICIAHKLSNRCPNAPGNQVRHHIRLDNGRAKAAQVYPAKLCKAICEGLI